MRLPDTTLRITAAIVRLAFLAVVGTGLACLVPACGADPAGWANSLDAAVFNLTRRSR